MYDLYHNSNGGFGNRIGSITHHSDGNFSILR